MKRREYKKLWIKARITWLCDRYGTVERGYLADYFIGKKNASTKKKLQNTLYAE